MTKQRLFLTLLFLLSGPLMAQEPEPTPKPEVKTPVVSVPIFPNTSCPIMGKPISERLYADTEFGRIYICCKGCDRKIKKDPEAAFKTAYPVVKDQKNKLCPVTGKTLDESAIEVTLQDSRFKVCCKTCVKKVQEDAQPTLAKIHDATIDDLANSTCPVTSKPVEKNLFVLIDKTMVRISSEDCIEKVKADPKTVLAAAKKSAEKKAVKESGNETDAAKD